MSWYQCDQETHLLQPCKALWLRPVPSTTLSPGLGEDKAPSLTSMPESLYKHQHDCESHPAGPMDVVNPDEQ